MVTETLARQAEALAKDMGRPFEDTFAEVLGTPAGRLLAELADGPHRHESAAYWQARLRAELEVKGGRFGALPTLVITANPERSVAARAAEVGARGVLSKMVSTKEMAET